MNCVIIDDDQLSCKILSKFATKTEGIDLIKIFNDPIEAMNNFDFSTIDLIFLDIEMPEMTGIELLKSLKNPPQIIIVSSQDKYAIDAYNLDVTDYLLKPVTYARFFKAIKKVYQYEPQIIEVEPIKIEDGVFVKKNNAFHKVRYNDIVWVEALENYVAFTTIQNNKFTLHKSLKAVEAKLSSSFRRIHRSYIVNMNKVKIIEDNNIIVDVDNTEFSIPIGKSYREKLIKDLTTF